MLLVRLKEYAERELAQPPPFYQAGWLRYLISLSGDGTPTAPEPLDLADPSSRAARRGQRVPLPLVQRVGLKPLLLADNAEYTFGLPRPPAAPERAATYHQAYLALIERCAEATREPAVCAVLRFLRDEPLERLRLPAVFDPSGTITFEVDGVRPIDLPAVRAFWAAENDPERAAGGARVLQCIVCGQERPVLPRLPGKLKGVPGGQTAGTALISADKNGFESYGLENSLIAPTCLECAERFTLAANTLLGGEQTSIRLGNSAFIFWTREPVGLGLGVLTNPDPEEVRHLIASARSGRVQRGVDDTAFYATLLSGSGGRAVVRDWIDTTVGEVKRQLARWFAAQRIVDEYGGEPQPLPLFHLASATVRDANKEMAPSTVRALLETALRGEPLPRALLAAAVRRTRAEGKVRRRHAALIKLALLHRWAEARGNGAVATANCEAWEDELVALNPERPEAAYHYGRALAVIERIQRAAIPGINATVVDRFYGAASSTPATVFPRLLSGAQPHLSKLKGSPRNQRAGLALEQRLAEILERVDRFEPTLTVEEQGLFALGFYHQRAHDRAAARAGAAARGAAAAASAVSADADADVNLDHDETDGAGRVGAD